MDEKAEALWAEGRLKLLDAVCARSVACPPLPTRLYVEVARFSTNQTVGGPLDAAVPVTGALLVGAVWGNRRDAARPEASTASMPALDNISDVRIDLVASISAGSMRSAGAGTGSMPLSKKGNEKPLVTMSEPEPFRCVFFAPEYVTPLW